MTDLHVSAFADRTDNEPQVFHISWGALADKLNPTVAECTVETCTGKKCPHKDGLLWSPASYGPNAIRRNENVIAVNALALDLDHLPDDAVAGVRERLAGLNYVLHSTHNDKPGDRCLRAVVEMSRPVPGREWPRFWAAAMRMVGLAIDMSCSEPSRMYYVPSIPRGRAATYERAAGEPLDVDGLLAFAPPPDPTPTVPVARAAPGPLPDPGEPAPDAAMAAAEALAAVWPKVGKRHGASLALVGALTSAGWPIERIVEFVCAVTVLAGGGAADGEPETRRTQATRAAARLAAGDTLAGWGTLIAEHGIPPIAADTVRGHLGLGKSRRGDPKVLEAIMAEAARKAVETAPEGLVTDDFRALLDQAAADVIDALAAATSAASGEVRPMFEPAAALVARAFPPTPWLVERLVTEGAIAALAGEPKTGKSWVACELAMAVASATSVFGKFRVPKPRRVAYFFAEDMGQSIRNRLRALAKSRSMDVGAAVEGLYVQSRGRNLDITREADLAVLVASCRRIGNVDLLILDPLRDVHSGEEDKSDDMAMVMRHMRVLGTLLGCAVLFVHHMGKSNADNTKRRQGQKMRGSSAIHGSVDCGIYLTGLTGDGEAQFVNDVLGEVKGARSAGSFSLELRVTDDENHEAIGASWQVGEATREQQPAAAQAEAKVVDLLRVLLGETKAMSQMVIRKKIGGRQAEVDLVIQSAHRGRLVKQAMSGGRPMGWLITEEGREAFRKGMADATAETDATPPTATDPAIAGWTGAGIAPPGGDA